MNENINIRKASSADLEALLTWGYNLYEAEKNFEPLMLFSYEEARARYSNQINNPDCLFLIAELNGKAIGYLYAHLDKVPYIETDKKECFLEVIYLEPEARGKGISTQLINNCIHWATENNALRVRCDIFAKNQASIKTFEKSGFELSSVVYSLEL